MIRCCTARRGGGANRGRQQWLADGELLEVGVLPRRQIGVSHGFLVFVPYVLRFFMNAVDQALEPAWSASYAES